MLESDWRELFRWTLSIDGGHRWRDHILTVLIEIVQKDTLDYRDSFIQGRGTSIQNHYTKDLRTKIEEWIEHFIGYEYNTEADPIKDPALWVAQNIRAELKDSLYGQHHKTQTSKEHPANLSYYCMLNAVNSIKQKCDFYVAKIEQSGDMDGSLALLITFIRHYSDIARRFNTRFSALSNLYLNEVLKVQSRIVAPDKAYVVITPANEENGGFTLPRGTAFIAGTTTGGDPLLYRTLSEEYISPVKLSYQLLNRAASGWMVVSPVLQLAYGRRHISICFEQVGDISDGDILKSKFGAQISTTEGWLDSKFELSSIKGQGFCFELTLEADQAATALCTQETHGVTIKAPAIRIVLKEFSQDDHRKLCTQFRSIKIEVEVTSIHNLSLYNELGQLDPTQPFYPFGTQAEKGSWFVFGNMVSGMICRLIRKLNMMVVALISYSPSIC